MAKKATTPTTHISIWEAQMAVMQEVSYVQKKGRVGTGKYGYSFAGESDLIAQLRPAMVAHGIVMYPKACEVISTENYETHSGKRASLLLTKRTFVFAHTTSGTLCEIEVFGEASDGGDKRASKAMTLAKKYALREFFLIETGDDPDEVISSRGEENVGYVQRAVRALESCSSVDELDGKLGSILSFDGAGCSEDQADDIKGKALELKGRMLNG